MGNLHKKGTEHMMFISHRGNINGAQPENENRPEYINQAMEAGYSVEIDVWKINGKFFLGHDTPDYEVPLRFLTNRSTVVMVNAGEPELLCHAKNLDALEAMLTSGIHCFWHEEDAYTITSRGIIISYPGNAITSRSICMKPELINQDSIDRCYGICSDYIDRYREEKQESKDKDGQSFNTTR